MNEKQNTFRTLREETPLIKSIWCYLGFHNWTMWGDAEKGTWQNPFSMNRHNVLFQYRCCGNCNKISRIKLVLGTPNY